MLIERRNTKGIIIWVIVSLIVIVFGAMAVTAEHFDYDLVIDKFEVDVDNEVYVRVSPPASKEEIDKIGLGGVQMKGYMIKFPFRKYYVRGTLTLGGVGFRITSLTYSPALSWPEMHTYHMSIKNPFRFRYIENQPWILASWMFTNRDGSLRSVNLVLKHFPTVRETINLSARPR